MGRLDSTDSVPLSAPQRSPRHLLADELSRSEAELDLGRSSLLVAAEEYPQLSVDLYLARLDQVAEEVKDRLANETAPLVVLNDLLKTLYERRKFAGNRKAYYDPRNSFLNDVLDRGVGERRARWLGRIRAVVEAVDLVEAFGAIVVGSERLVVDGPGR